MTDHDYLKAAKEASHVPHMGSFYALVAIAEELRRMNDRDPGPIDLAVNEDDVVEYFQGGIHRVYPLVVSE